MRAWAGKFLLGSVHLLVLEYTTKGNMSAHLAIFNENGGKNVVWISNPT